MTKPNIVEIVWHDLGDWLSCFGRPDVSSPNLNALAGEGMRFENHFCPAPQCSPSRASIKTGRYPQSHGVMGLTHRGWRYAAGEWDLPLLLRGAGYRSVLVGFQHERHDKAELTYDEHWTHLASALGMSAPEETGADVVADRAVDFLAKRARASRPFFLSIGLFDVHRVYGTDYDPDVAARLIVPGFLPDEPIVRKDLATFYEKIRRADAAVGRILRALSAADLAEDTLVYFTTDHGPEFPRAKMTLYDPGIKTALLVRFPHVVRAGARSDALTTHVDLVPTLLELAGLSIPTTVQGRSMLGLLRGEPYAPRDAIFAQMTWHGGEYDPMRCIRTARFKYIRNYVPGWPPQIGGACVERYGEAFVNAHFGIPRPAEELYDLAADPWEQHNLAARPEKRSLRQELAARLAAWMREVDDPLLRGPVPFPDPTRVGSGCVWGKFAPHDPVAGDCRFAIVRTRDFGERPL